MARKDTVWQNRTGGYIETTNPSGYDVLINGTNKYLNFGILSGTTGYGFRDNGGVMEYKNSGGSWAAISSGGGSQLPTIVVAASGGDVTTIQGALDLAASSYAQGCKIYLTDDAYYISTGLLVKSNNVIIEGNNQSIEVDGSVVPTLWKTNSAAAGYEGFALRNLRFVQTNASALGVCIDASDMALQKHDNLVIFFFATGIKMLDTQNITFYNRFANIKITQIGSVGINIDSHTGNPVNDNMFDNIRCSYAASGIGVLIDNAQSNNFYNCNFEPGSNSGTIGVKLLDTNGDSTFDNSFYGVYIEANATGISVGSGVARTSFFAGEVVENTANLSDSGTDTGFFNTDIGYVPKNQITQLTARQVINTNNAIAASGNAATVPITYRTNTVTNNSAATLTITIATAGAVDGQQVLVRVLDFSAVAQTITWVNTENSQTSAPTTSNGSTTLPLTVGFQFNGNTSKWRCIGVA